MGSLFFYLCFKPISMMDKADGWLLIHNTPEGVGCRTKVEGCYGMVYEIWDTMHDAWNNCHNNCHLHENYHDSKGGSYNLHIPKHAFKNKP
jgi:hypothetical protein